MNTTFSTILGLLLMVFGDKDARKRLSENFRQGFKSKKDLLKDGIDIDKVEELQKYE